MRPFTILKSKAAPFAQQDVDTDQIIPARFLKEARNEFGKFAFYDLRFDSEGCRRSEFILNKAEYREAQILICGKNFGCGSSREGAVWALQNEDGGLFTSGLRCIIAPSFGDIFSNNCAKNGLLALCLEEGECQSLRELAIEDPNSALEINLETQTVTDFKGKIYTFEIDPFRKECLLKGLDDYALTMQHELAIVDYEKNARKKRPWVFDPDPSESKASGSL